MSLYQRAMKRAGHTLWFAATFKRTLPHIDRAISKLSRGRVNFASTVVPTLLLTHTGAKSGKTYRTPIAYTSVDGRYYLVASNWGGANHPGWSYNLLANPTAEVTVDGRTTAARARRLSEAERAEVWPRFVEIWPAFDTYVERAGGRKIRVFVLDPV